MMHWLVAPVILPAMLAPIVAMTMRHDMVLQRVFSMAGTVALALIALGLASVAFTDRIGIYELGDWPAPFGIVLVLDRLSATMLVLTSILAIAVLLYAIGSGWDRKGWHFHALFQFQLMGVNGAFLTGDVFNLFVFFEILLIASYGLMIHGGGADRLRAGVQYVVMNLAGSTLFLFALGAIYATLGTLNMADLALKIREVGAEDQALVMVAGTLLLLVFAIKAAAFPVQFWLPGTYANAPAPVAALFAVMTKVGVYAILRTHILIFGPGNMPQGTIYPDMLLPAALATLVVGALGVLGARTLPRLIAFSVLASLGTLLTSVALFSQAGLSAALYYIVHSTFAAAALFLISDLVARSLRNGAQAPGGLVASLYFAAAIAMAGMPPLSGFLGKLLVLNATGPHPWGTTIWALILGSSLVIVVGFARMGSRIFWKPTGTPGEAPAPLPALAVTAAFIPLGVLALWTVLAGAASDLSDATAHQLRNTETYIAAVLKHPADAGDPAAPHAAVEKPERTEGH